MEFARRTRRLYGEREAVVDGDLRLTYEQFFDRCDRWSAALAGARRRPRRSRRVHRAEHARAARVVLRRAAARRGARADQLPADRRTTSRTSSNHSGATVVCAHADYLDGRRTASATRCPGSALRRARGDARRAGSTTRRCDRRRRAPASTRRRSTRPTCSTINYTSGTTARPKGVMITHRNAYDEHRRHAGPPPDAAERALPLDAADVPRQRLDVHVDRDGGRRAPTSACAGSSPRRSSS